MTTHHQKLLLRNQTYAITNSNGAAHPWKERTTTGWTSLLRRCCLCSSQEWCDFSELKFNESISGRFNSPNHRPAIICGPAPTTDTDQNSAPTPIPAPGAAQGPLRDLQVLSTQETAEADRRQVRQCLVLARGTSERKGDPRGACSSEETDTLATTARAESESRRATEVAVAAQRCELPQAYCPFGRVETATAEAQVRCKGKKDVSNGKCAKSANGQVL